MTVLNVVERDGLMGNAIRQGALIRNGLGAALAGVRGVVDIRGQGLMIGIELDRPCAELMTRALSIGLLINVTAEKVIRLLPPLTFSEEESKELVARLAELIHDFLKI